MTEDGCKFAAGKLRQARGKRMAKLRQLRGKHKAGHHGGHSEQYGTGQTGEECGGLLEEPFIGADSKCTAGLKEMIQAGAQAGTEAVGKAGGERVEPEFYGCKRAGKGTEQGWQLAQEAAQLPEEDPPEKEQAAAEQREEQERAEKGGQPARRMEAARAERDRPLREQRERQTDEERKQNRQQNAHEQEDTERSGKDTQRGTPNSS